MKKQNEVRYIVTDVVSIPVFRLARKTEAYRQAVKPGWGTVKWYSAADGYKNPVSRDRSDKTQQLVCDEDSSADLYTKNGGYFGISPYEEINTKEMPKQAACAAIIHSDSCGLDFWTEDGQIRIFVTYDVNGLIDSYRLEYGEDAQPYDGEMEIRFEDLYQQPEGDWKETYRAELPGTVEYQFKQEAARLAETAGATWMDADQQEQFRRICNLIDKIKSGRACMFLDPLHIEAADAVEIMAMDVVEVKHLEMELRTVVKAETAERLIRIFRKQPEEKQAAFIETTIKAARGGADYSTCQTIEDIANVFAKYFVESAGGV